MTPLKLWELASDVKDELIEDYPDKVNIINNLFPARVLGLSIEDAVLASLGNPPNGQLQLPPTPNGIYTARPEARIEWGPYGQEMIVEVKTIANTSPNYVFNNWQNNLNQYTQYIDYIRDHVLFPIDQGPYAEEWAVAFDWFEIATPNNTSFGGIYLVLNEGVEIDDNLVQMASNANVSLYVSRLQTSTVIVMDEDENPQEINQIALSEIEWMNKDDININAHMLSFIYNFKNRFFRMTKRKFYSKFDFENIDLDFENRKNLFILSHLSD